MFKLCFEPFQVTTSVVALVDVGDNFWMLVQEWVYEAERWQIGCQTMIIDVSQDTSDNWARGRSAKNSRNRNHVVDDPVMI